MSLVEDIALELKLISRDTSSRKIMLLNEGYSEDTYKNISDIDEEQRSRVTNLFYKNSIYNQEQANELFYRNNKIFFYGTDPTGYGPLNQMFLYDIDNIEKSNVNILGKSKEFDWITVGIKHFHGVYDFIESEKVGAHAISTDKVVFYDDANEMFDQVVDIIKNYKNKQNCGMLRLMLEQWGNNEASLNSTIIENQYMSWLKIHEASHLILDDILEIGKRSLNNDEYEIYNIESERFAILSQMAFSDLHAYTLLNFIEVQGNINYNAAVLSILDDFFDIMKSNRNSFPDKITTGNIESLALLSNNQIGCVAEFLFKQNYEKVLFYKERLNWYFDLNKKRIVFVDSKNNPLNTNITLLLR